MATVGKVTTEIEWKIPKFCALSAFHRDSLDSPSFAFANASWCLRMYLNTYYSYPYCNGLFLRRISPGPAINLKFSLGFKDLNGKKVAEKHYMLSFDTKGRNVAVEYGDFKYPSTHRYYRDKDKLLPSSILTIFCTLIYHEPVTDTSRFLAPLVSTLFYF